MAHSKSTTRKRRTSQAQPIPTEGKYIVYSRDDGHIAYLDGELVGYYDSRQEAEEALDAIVYARLTHQQEVQAW